MASIITKRGENVNNSRSVGFKTKVLDSHTGDTNNSEIKGSRSRRRDVVNVKRKTKEYLRAPWEDRGRKREKEIERERERERERNTAR